MTIKNMQNRFSARLFAGAVIGVLLTTVLSACTAMPNDGPLLNEIVADIKSNPENASPYAVIDISTKSLNSLRKIKDDSFHGSFSNRGGAGSHIVSIGDTLNLTIFESGTEGLFTSDGQKSTSLELQVDPRGEIPVPYAGTVKVSGKSFEKIRAEIVEKLKNKTSEPDVIVSLKSNNSQFVSVNGAVGRPNVVPLTGREKVLDALAAAGGPSNAPYDTTITLTRGTKNKTISLQSLVTNPAENVFLRSSDQLFLVHAPRTFSAFGAVNKRDNIKFETAKLSLVEAASMAGGIDPNRADAGGYFLFRYEHESALSQSLDAKAFAKMKKDKTLQDASGKWPVVYRLDFSQANGYLLAQQFEMRDKDVIYVSRKPSVDFLKFLGVIRSVSSEVRAY